MAVPKENIVPKELWPELVEVPEIAQKLGPERNFTEVLIDKNLDEGRKNRAAILYRDTRLTYRDLYYEVNRFASALADIGVEKLDRVAFRVGNTPEGIIAVLGIMRAGALPIPMHPRWAPRQIAYVANNAEVKAIITGADPKTLPAVEQSLEQLKVKPHIIVVRAEKEQIPQLKEKGYSIYEEFIEKGRRKFEPVRLEVSEEPILLLYTSGTTGPPKGCLHFMIGVSSIAEDVGKYHWKLTEEDVIGGVAPISFAMGFGTYCIIPFLFGASASLLDEFTPDLLFKTIQDHGITVLTLAPTGYRKLLALPNFDELWRKYDLSSLRMCTGGGEMLGARTFEEWKKRTGIEIFEGLGATELFHVVLSSLHAGKPKAGSVGKPLPNVKVKIVNPETGEECKPGETGTAYIKAPTGIIYWKPYADDNRLLKKQTESVKEGWNVLGDFIYFDEDGYLWFISREDDLIKSSGYRIGPEEIEHALNEHPSVEEAACIGVPHPIKGEDTWAIVKLKSGYEPSDKLKEDIYNSLKPKVPTYMLPTRIEFYDKPLPKTPTEKLLRRELRKEFKPIAEEVYKQKGVK